MRRFTLILFILIFLTPGFAAGSKVWWVYFSDKKGSSFDPYMFFSEGAIARREKIGLSLYDVSDFPVSPSYLNQVSAFVDTMGYASRWMNAVSVVASEEEIALVRALSFVADVQLQLGFDWAVTSAAQDATDSDETLSLPQISRMQGDSFAYHHITGKGITIAILDAGFWGTNTHESFTQLFYENRITHTRNFLHGDSIIYDEKSDHGTMVLSCMAGAGIVHAKKMGMATGANFMLGIISKEYGNQYRAEERYIAGVEWADQYGANIINISGGPNENSYFAEDMDGKTPVISFACKMAARKGILVVAAAGNNGDHLERQLLPPAETDSVLSVTAMGDSGYVANYSSVGPPPDFRRKPDICAPGSVFVAAHDRRGDEYADSDGTSFSAPLVAGFAACLMELYPDITAMGTIDSLHKCAHLYPYYDYAHGYGVPQAGYFFRSENSNVEAAFTFNRSEIGITIQMNRGADTLTGSINTRLMFWNLTDSTGRIVEYNVIEVNSPNPVQVNFADYEHHEAYKMCVWYNGYYAETDF